MASTLKINTLTGVTTAGSIAVTGEGNSTTTNLQQGLVKNWCHSVLGSGTPANTDSFNTSSITDVEPGNYKPVFTSNMANATFAVGYSVQYSSTSGTGCFFHQSPPANFSTSDYNVQHFQNGSIADAVAFMSTIHGDLA